MQFKLNNNRKFLIKKGGVEIISNTNMTKRLALKFLRTNTELRKTLFEWLPEDIDEMLKPQKTKK